MRHGILLAVAIATGVAACSDVVHPTPPDEILSDRLFVYAALDPDEVHQWIAVAPVDARYPPVVTVAIYRKTSSQAGSGWTLVASDSSAGPKDHDHNPDCVSNLFSGAHCLVPHASLAPGAVYMVEATADGFPSARGATRIPGDFQVESATLSRNGGTHVISAEWTASDHVHRYLFAARRHWIECVNCFRAWNVDVDSTSFTGPLPQVAVDSLGPDPTVEVMAADEHLHAFVTSGLGDQLLSIPPVMNVEGGFGVVGSARYRTRSIAMPDQSAGGKSERRAPTGN